MLCRIGRCRGVYQQCNTIHNSKRTFLAFESPRKFLRMKSLSNSPDLTFRSKKKPEQLPYNARTDFNAPSATIHLQKQNSNITTTQHNLSAKSPSAKLPQISLQPHQRHRSTSSQNVPLDLPTFHLAPPPPPTPDPHPLARI